MGFYMLVWSGEGKGKESMRSFCAARSLSGSGAYPNACRRVQFLLDRLADKCGLTARPQGIAPTGFPHRTKLEIAVSVGHTCLARVGSQHLRSLVLWCRCFNDI